MTYLEPSTFLCAPIFSRLSSAFQKFKVPLLSSLIFGVLAHGFAFANKLPGYDDLTCTFDKGATYMSGRWGLILTEFLYPNQSMPWIYGFITLLLLSIASCIIVEMFHIRSKILQSIFSGCVIVFPSLSCTVIFLFTLPSYATSFLLAVLAAYFIGKHTVKHALWAIICAILSLSIYQSYISIIASLLVLLLIQALLQDVTPPISFFEKAYGI